MKKIVRMMFISMALIAFGAAPIWAASPKQTYHEAERCQKKLAKSEKKMKYRENWLRCIDTFMGVYEADPSGTWAAAGLYRAGVLYEKLYDRSRNATYQNEARDLFTRILNRFPDSKYRAKARTRLKETDSSLSKKRLAAAKKSAAPKKTPKKIIKKKPKKKIATKRAAKPGKKVSKTLAKKQYQVAEACYSKLKRSSKKMKYRENWLACIKKFKDAYQIEPKGPWAPASLYMSGILYKELYRRSKNILYQTDSFDAFRSVIARFPESAYRKKAYDALEPSLTGKQKRKIASYESSREKKAGQTAPAAKKRSGAPPKTQSVSASSLSRSRDVNAAGHATITGLKVWSDKRYTRIVIYADQETLYAHQLLKKDPSSKKPPRLYVDFKNSRLEKDIKKNIHVNDNLLVSVRSGQFDKDTARIVFDIKFFQSYSIFSLKNPFRTIIDVRGDSPKVAEKTQKTKLAKKRAAHSKKALKNGQAKTTAPHKKIQPGSIAKQLALGVSRIVIDPGHGGRDGGAPGYFKGVQEKNLTLAIAKRLAKKIRKEMHCEVLLTRSTDRALSLEERTAIANTKNADLFISLHTNAHNNRRAYGIETYILNFATDDDAIAVAARENATTEKNISDLETILNDLMHNTKVDESIRLAGYIQNSIVTRMKVNYSKIKNKGIKQAPFYVLMGAQMPAILIETSFISNKRECKRLMNRDYQDRLCDGIVRGIREYIRETKPSALIGLPSPGA